MAPRTPNASICFPVWRADPEHLRAAVASALAQDAPEVEVVVSVAADEAAGVRTTLARLADQVRLVEQPEGLTMVQHWNAVLGEALAPIVVLPGQDDVLRPAMVSTHLARHADPTVVLCASEACLVDDDGRTLPARRGPRRARSRLVGAGSRRLGHRELVELVLREGNVVGAPSQVSFHRADAERLGGFDDRYEHAADLDLWLRLSTSGDAVLVGAVLGTRRAHAGAATRVHRAEGAAAGDRQRLLGDHGGALDADGVAAAQAVRAQWSAADAVRAAVRRDASSARRHARDAWQVAPRSFGVWRRHLRRGQAGEDRSA